MTLGQEEAIKPLDKRAINFLINEYLLLQNYKLTSVTFSEENENQVIYFISGFYKYQNYCQIHRIPMKMWYIFHPNTQGMKENALELYQTTLTWG